MTIGNFKYIYDVPVSIIRCDDLDTKHQGFVCILNKDTKVVDVFSIIRSVPYDSTDYVGSFIADEVDVSNGVDVWENFQALQEWFNWKYDITLVNAKDPVHGNIWLPIANVNRFKPIEKPDHMVYSWKIAQSVK